MSDHTPGPWTCHGVTFEDCNRNSAAYIIECVGGMPASRANAHLIASAPELLEALEAFQKHVITHSCTWDDSENASHHHPIWQQVANAISKARGQ